LFRGERLTRDHLLEIAAHGFEAVEVAIGSGHFEPAHEAAVADLQQWLAEAQLDLHAVAAAGPDEPQQEQALTIARRIPVGVLVLPVGAPKSASKTVERLAAVAEPLGVTLAIDSRSPSMTPIGSLVSFVERCEGRVGIALDFAGAARGGGLVDAIEMTSEHLAAARVPAESAIDWSSAMTTIQKVGYEGPFIVDVAGNGVGLRAAGGSGLKAALASARSAREKMERWLTST
jgi:sugar phosphate isomerase/epimerase